LLLLLPLFVRVAVRKSLAERAATGVRVRQVEIFTATSTLTTL
jgi:hypothetical protein